MSERFLRRLANAKEKVASAGAILSRHSDAFNSASDSDPLKVVTNLQASMGHLENLVRARVAARSFLTDLEGQTDEADTVVFGTNRLAFSIARFLGTQAYLATNWALADRTTALAGRVLCTANAGANPTAPPQLMSDFVKDGRKKSSPAGIGNSIRDSFGYPIAVSYAIRNHFIHDGGMKNASDFFAGANSAAGFQLSASGWEHVEKRVAVDFNLTASMHRKTGAFFHAPRADLRLVLDECDAEIDESLGILLGNATALLLAHVQGMSGEDLAIEQIAAPT